MNKSGPFERTKVSRSSVNCIVWFCLDNNSVKSCEIYSFKKIVYYCLTHLTAIFVLCRMLTNYVISVLKMHRLFYRLKRYDVHTSYLLALPRNQYHAYEGCTYTTTAEAE